MPFQSSNLRWRAKFHKEAYEEDDSTAVLIHDDDADNDEKTKDAFHMTRLQRITSFILHASSGLAVLTAVYSLAHTKTWFLAWAATLTTTIACLCSWQQTRLVRLGSIRSICQETRKTVHQLRQQNERLHRHLAKFDQAMDRVQHTQTELQKVADAKDMQKLLPLADKWRTANLEMQKHLQQSVREQLLRAVLETDRNHDFTLTPPEVNRLILRLQHLPGVVVNEKMLRAQLTVSEPSLAAMLRLLRVAAAAGPGNGLMTDETAVFSYHPRQLLQPQQDLLS